MGRRRIEEVLHTQPCLAKLLVYLSVTSPTAFPAKVMSTGYMLHAGPFLANVLAVQAACRLQLSVDSCTVVVSDEKESVEGA